MKVIAGARAVPIWSVANWRREPDTLLAAIGLWRLRIVRGLDDDRPGARTQCATNAVGLDQMFRRTRDQGFFSSTRPT